MRSFILKKSYLIILLGFLVPPFVYVALRQSSNAAGILVVSFLFLLVYIKSIPKYISFRLLSVAFIFLIYSFISIFKSGDFFKVASSWGMFFFLVGVYGYFLREVYFKNDNNFVFTVKFSYFVLISLGIISLLYRFPFLGYEHRPANVFPFAEHSHYSIAYSFFAFAYQFYVRSNKGFHTSFVTILFGLAFPSLTMLIVGLMLAFVLRIRNRLLILTVVTLFAIFPALFLFSDYFLSRLVFNEGSLDLSNLVYLQGWESAWIGINETNGLGLGFQALGTQSPGIYTELIRSVLDGHDLNRNDGGFLAAKFIGEFGVLGILVCLKILFNFVKVVRAAQKNQYRREPLTVIYMALSMGMFIEFFVRGFGYFSPAFILFASFALQPSSINIAKQFRLISTSSSKTY